MLYDGREVSKGYANGILGGTRDKYTGWQTTMRPPFSAAAVQRAPMPGKNPRQTWPALRTEPWHGSGGSEARRFIEDPSPCRVFRRSPPPAVFALPAFENGQFRWPTRLPTPVERVVKPQREFKPKPHHHHRSGITLENNKDFTKDFAVGTLNRGIGARGKNRVRGGQNYGQNVQTGVGFDGVHRVIL